MKPPTSQSLFLLIKCLVVLALPVYHLSYHYLLPYWRVRPILRMLSSPDMEDVRTVALAMRGFEYDPDVVPFVTFYGREAYLVEQQILSILLHIEDVVLLEVIMLLIDSPPITPGPSRLDFGKYGEEEWNIIKDAVDRIMKLLPEGDRRVFEIHDTHGILSLQPLFR